MRFEVPQFIEIEDKIIGPFTWKQFVYLAGGVGVGVVSYIVFGLIVFLLIGLPLTLLALLLAFYPVNNRPFSIFLESVVNYYKKTKMYYWHKRTDVVYRDRASGDARSASGIQTMPTTGKGGINSLSRKLEMQALQKVK